MGTLMKASKKYHSLNRDALKLIDDNGGLLMTCTCSSAMAQKDGGRFFLQTVQQASLSAGRQVTLLRVSGAASCHTQSPVSFPAGNYLTAALFYVHPLN
jgi:23S rRNA G2069 N7-methylase RlmK/C1962 C5-methylase RlmI